MRVMVPGVIEESMGSAFSLIGCPKSGASQSVSGSRFLLGPDHTPGTTRTPTPRPGVDIPAITAEFVTAHQLVTVVVDHAVFAGCLDDHPATLTDQGQEEPGGISEDLKVAVRDRPPGHLEVGVGLNPVRSHPRHRFSKLVDVGGF